MRFREPLLLLLFTLSLGKAFSQVSRIQFINNCPDISVQGVDVYVDGIRIFDDVPFRFNTQYIPINSTTNTVNIGIADQNAGGVVDTFYSTSVTLSGGNDYIVVLNGVRKSSTGYNPTKPLSLAVFGMARESALFPPGTDILFVHGGTDAPAPIDIRSGIMLCADDIGYNQVSKDYSQFLQKNNTIRLTNSANTAILKNYGLPFPTLTSYAGKAAVIVASGFMTPANNNNGPSFGLYMSVPGTAGPLLPLDTTVQEPLARIQLINNVADTAGDSLDVYFDNVKAATKLAFRTATPYQDIPARVPVAVSFAYPNSTSLFDTFYSTVIACDSGQNYLGIANGILSDTFYTPRPAFNMNTFSKTKLLSGSGQTDILTYNGSTDAPDLNITDGTNLYGSGLSYNNFNALYTTVTTTNTVLKVTKSSGATKIQDYDANWQSLGLQGKAITLLTSGFIDTAKNSEGPMFGLYYVGSDGGALTPLPIHTVSVEKIQTPGVHITAWPNPANSTLYLQGNMPFDKISAAIYDIAGKLVKSELLKDARINVQSLPSGKYSLKLISEKATANLNFIKE